MWSELRLTSTPQLSISISPHLTALAWVADALAGRRRGLPEGWRAALAGHVGAAGHRAARPLAAPDSSVAPDCLVPHAPVGADVSVHDQVGALHDLPPDRLIADLEQAFGQGPVPAHWRSAAERPAAWLHGYADALTEVWEVGEPLWRRARVLLDREVMRVGTAVVRGGPELLLGALSDRIVHTGRALRVATPEPAGYDLGDRPIVLVPMLAGKDAVIMGPDHREAAWIAYPVPGARTLWSGPAAPAYDELSALMGPVRADLLGAIGRPKTMSMLAADMKIAPSSITYHCDRLRAARLITRERRGREVWIARTERAEELLELFRR
ncbi:ArsR/SmtB family transcription factor [Nonomuraea candida]|uniref:ArsR/SmtB family transcription factor n=1 Tax=Nonomuraea candida TaxID=359159 RepID=UPI0005BC7B6A|nr:winged helix-turn-helix domain-containing protein [Nonomuraea candida]